jgi:hypothetical protein
MKNSEIQVDRAASGDFDDILYLQKKYYVGNLTDEQRQEGFLSAEFSLSQITAMAEDLGIFVARVRGHFAGYVGTSRIDLLPRPPILDAMTTFMDGVCMKSKKLSDMNLFIYGPACIDEPYRGKGVLRDLFGVMNFSMKESFDGGVAFISSDNPRSYGAHVKGLDMEDLGTFNFGGSSYHLVGFFLS